jgi:hypothetical protein
LKLQNQLKQHLQQLQHLKLQNNDRNDQCVTALFDNTGRPSFYLSSILDILNLKHNNTFETILEVTQKNLLRTSGKERWEVDDVFKDKKHLLDPLFKKIHCVDALYATQSHYDYAVVLGAAFKGFYARLQWLIQEWQRGVRFTTLVFLSGYRVLPDAERDELKVFSHKIDVPTNEFEMIQSVYQTVPMPEALRKVPVVFVNAPARNGKNRATTEDTVNAWLELRPVPGSILAISNQPYVLRQHCILRTVLPDDFSIESTGPAISGTTSTTIILDNLARWIFQINCLIAVPNCS